MKKIILGLIVLVFSATSYGGAQETHGGDAILCHINGSNKMKVELLDYLEATQLYKLTLDLGPENTSWLEKVKYVLDRLSLIDPVSAKRYMDKAKIFEQETAFLDRALIKDIDDSAETIDPLGNCKRTQWAVQRFSALKKYESRYVVDKNIWTAANEMQKAGLVLHEVILWDAYFYYDHTDSKDARYYNAVISSSEMSNIVLKPTNYLDLLRETGFTNRGQTIHSLKMGEALLGDVVFRQLSDSPAREGIQGCLVNKISVNLKSGATLTLGSDIPRTYRHAQSHVFFDRENRLYRFSIVEDQEILMNNQKIILSMSRYAGCWQREGLNEIDVYPNGNIKQAVLRRGVYASTNRKYNTQPLSLAESCEAINDFSMFSEDGNLTVGILEVGSQVILENGKTKILKEKMKVFFDEQGLVTMTSSCKKH